MCMYRGRKGREGWREGGGNERKGREKEKRWGREGRRESFFPLLLPSTVASRERREGDMKKNRGVGSNDKSHSLSF